jgi:hypothetical protein
MEFTPNEIAQAAEIKSWVATFTAMTTDALRTLLSYQLAEYIPWARANAVASLYTVSDLVDALVLAEVFGEHPGKRFGLGR